ncbi:unnamed protein product [Cyclocybe aegerita]|uniref:Large ribosomal subunit protein bL28m n=1 Tax=Cyclocybe aegerita TaxID=1973307 RepID=A0A8S0WQZ9_CYCAE|nr:unnamed protein product [Cyclocybe aegerita]
MSSSKILPRLVSQPFKRSQFGLFQGKMKQAGNNVPFSKHKTRRTWLPNVQRKRVPSEILGGNVRVKLTTRALKTIHKKGGLDNYLKTTAPELLGLGGMKLRTQMREAELVQQGRKVKQYTVPTISRFDSIRKASPGPSPLTLQTARLARLMAAASLNDGGSGLEPASVEDTIAYLEKTSSQ